MSGVGFQFWWNLFEFFCNGDLPLTFARPRFARRSLGGASLRSVEPRFARRDGLASLRREPRFARREPRFARREPRFARLEASENGTPSGEPSGGLPAHRSVTHRYSRTGATHRSCSPALLTHRSSGAAHGSPEPLTGAPSSCSPERRTAARTPP